MTESKTKQDVLFTLVPKNGFYKSNNQMAMLDDLILYHAHDIGEENNDGVVYLRYSKDGSQLAPQIRVWATAKPNQKLCTEFFIQTTTEEENNFTFLNISDSGGIQPIGKPIKIIGAAIQVLRWEFETDDNGNAVVGLFATKSKDDYTPWEIRKIQVSLS